MNHLNSLLIEGTVVQDPSIVWEGNGNDEAKLVRFVIASDRYFVDRQGKTQKETLFLPVTAWNKLGELSLKFLKKGVSVRCVGKLRMSKWENEKGEARSAIELSADHIEFKKSAKSKQDGSEGGEIKAETFILDEDKTESKVGESVVLYHF